MISEYEFNDFRNNLEQLTKKGYALIKGNPFAFLSINFSSRPFYGNIDKNKFTITQNANMYPIPYLIKGTFKKKGNQTEISYEIIQMRFAYHWFRIFPLIANVMGLICIISNLEIINSKVLTFVEILFILLIFESILFAPIFINKIKKRKFEKEFIKRMKIIIPQ
ncbi:hypothetical protein JI747_000380 [Chryseobacterium sp. RG1]|uniref:DUF2812 domain-containing protein n=1 Tax=Chryseobacterium tagetis TaxID=2801334 RepID=A0ABS7ZV43_9FLAO|nr:hypothetical protein [Chryseobacterium tagetis]MCA6065609.1 hypothetical protein [Chryseobacterium tagetis]